MDLLLEYILQVHLFPPACSSKTVSQYIFVQFSCLMPACCKLETSSYDMFLSTHIMSYIIDVFSANLL